MDFNHRLGRKALRKLRNESIVWLTTVGANGQPQPRPVWFHWNGKDVLIFTPPRTAKLRQIAHNPRTAIHFNADREGTDVVVLVGRARIASRVAQERRAAYLRSTAAT